MVIDELQQYLFDGQPHALAEPITTWLVSSRRFAAFVTNFRAKIRKKLRTTSEREGQLDLQFELEIAFRLLQARAFTVIYEPLPVRQMRSPDFAVRYTTSLSFMVEGTRLRTESTNPTAVAESSVSERIAEMVCGKLGQLLPQQQNILVVGCADPQFSEENVRAALAQLVRRVEQNDNDAPLLQRYGLRDRADFFHHYQRLNEVLVRRLDPMPAEPLITWVNPQAKSPLPSKVRSALYRSFREPAKS